MSVIVDVQKKLSDMIDQLCKSWNMPRYVNQTVTVSSFTNNKKAESDMPPKVKSTQDIVIDYLRQSGRPPVTTQEIADALRLSANQVKHAAARLYAKGHVLRTTDRPTKWYASPQVVQTPPQGSPGSIHNVMPQA